MDRRRDALQVVVSHDAMAARAAELHTAGATPAQALCMSGLMAANATIDVPDEPPAQRNFALALASYRNELYAARETLGFQFVDFDALQTKHDRAWRRLAQCAQLPSPAVPRELVDATAAQLALAGDPTQVERLDERLAALPPATLVELFSQLEDSVSDLAATSGPVDEEQFLVLLGGLCAIAELTLEP